VLFDAWRRGAHRSLEYRKYKRSFPLTASAPLVPCHLTPSRLLGSAHPPSAAPYGERPARVCLRLPAPSGAIPRLAGASAAGEPRRQYTGSRPAAAAGRAAGQAGLRVTGRTRSERQHTQ
jgi:hypothetical protein